MPLPKPIALVTGSRRGIGFGIASCLAREGFDLVINASSPPADAAEAVGALEKLGAQVIYCQADISLPDARRAMVEEVRRRFGRLNVLVNNAGVAPKVRADLLEATEESFERLIKINLQGPYFLSQEVARWMIAQKQADAAFQGCIINISSISSEVASPNRGDYCIAKAGLSMMTKLFATRLGEYDLPVYEIRPGVIATDMTSGVKEKYDKLISEGLLLQKRWGTPDDIGKAVAMFARRDLPYSTGMVIDVDGGLMLRRL